jgi:NAD/NADP transhydrogenase beta subunit
MVGTGLSHCGRAVHSGAAGLSSPGTSRAGNRYGMIGMTIAVVTTLVTHIPGLEVFERFHVPPAAA